MNPWRLPPPIRGGAEESRVRKGRMGSRELFSRKHGKTIKARLTGGAAPPAGAEIGEYRRFLLNAFKEYGKRRGSSLPEDPFALRVATSMAEESKTADQQIMLGYYTKILQMCNGNTAEALKAAKWPEEEKRLRRTKRA